jgi:hypothetical protein
MKLSPSFSWICALSLWISAPSHAASPASYKDLKPFLDNYTIAVVELNLDQLDVSDTTARLLEALPEPRDFWAEPIQQARAILEPWHQHVRDAGGQRIYIVSSLSWLHDVPPVAVLVPLTPTTDDERLKTALGMVLRHWEFRSLHGCLVSAPGHVLRHLEPSPTPPTDLTRWQAAFDAAPPGVVRLLLVPYAESARVIEDILPRLPSMLGGGPGSTLVRGFQWGGVSLRVSPAAGLRLVIQSESPDAALALQEVIEHGLAAAGQSNEIQRDFPAWAHLQRLLLPRVVEDRIERELELTEVVELAQSLQPTLEEARAKAQRVATVNQLKQIGLALRIHAADHGDRFPLHLVDILPFLGNPRVLLKPGAFEEPPPDLAEQSREARVAWIDQHSPFLYIQPGVSLKEISNPSSTVAVHERLEPGRDEPVGVLFVDGSVQLIPQERLREMLNAAGG